MAGNHIQVRPIRIAVPSLAHKQTSTCGIGALALDEQITWRMLAGAGLVALAIALNAVAGGRARSEEPPAVLAAGG